MYSKGRIQAVSIVLLLVVSVVVIALKGKVSTELSVFLPEPVSKAERLLHHQLDKGASTNLLFVALTGKEERELAEVSRDFAQKLLDSGSFSRVTNSAGSVDIDDFATLEKYRYLLSHGNLEERFSVEGFRASLQSRMEGLVSSTASIEKRYLRQDPTGEILRIVGELKGKLSKHKTPRQHFGVWFSEDGERALLLLEIKSFLSTLTHQKAAVREVHRIFEEVRNPGLDLIMTGPAAFAAESEQDIRGDVRFLTYLAVCCVVLFLFLAYRSILSVVFIAMPLVVGVVIATACVLLLQQEIHGITLAFGITLAGVAVDYPIHLLTGLETDEEASSRHISQIWKTLILGVLSTVLAYAAFLVSGFGGLQQLGLFTIVGLVSAAWFSRYVLPIVASRKPILGEGLARFHQALKYIGMRAPRYRWLVVSVMVVALGSMVITDRPILHMNVDSLSPIKDSRRAEGKMLRGDLGFWFGGSMLIATGETKEEALVLTESLADGLDELIERGVIQGYDMAAHFLPSQKRQAEKQAELANTEKIVQNLNTAMEGFPFRDEVFEPFIEAIENSKTLPLLTADMLGETPVGEKLGPLLFNFEDEAGAVVLLHGVEDTNAMEQFVSQYDSVIYMHLKTEATGLVSRSVDRVSLIMLGSILAIYLCLAIAFRSATRPFKIMIPTFAASIAVAGILVFSNTPLSIFHLISLLLVVGLGLDYALFFNRLPGHTNEWNTTFRSLWICGITTVLVFGILTFSQTPPLRAIGVTVGLGAFISIVFAAMWATKPEKE